MSLPKFPKPDALREAVTTYAPGIVTDEQIASLKRAWPTDSSLYDLGQAVLEENELWDKAESYMINLIEPTSLLDRLKVWCFKCDWQEDKGFLTVTIKSM